MTGATKQAEDTLQRLAAAVERLGEMAGDADLAIETCPDDELDWQIGLAAGLGRAKFVLLRILAGGKP